jgi:heme exporter protein A
MSLFEGRDLLCVRGERRIFEGLAFAVAEGAALVVTGPNGSGKSSLLRVMAGLLKPAAGALYWDGEPVSDDPDAHRTRLQYLGHLDAVKPVLTAAENVRFWAGVNGADGVDGVERALEGFSLGHLAEMPGRMLSSGQRRRVALARLLASGSDLWLLDEPTVGLDTASLGQLGVAIAAHRARGGRVVVATHAPLDMPGAETLRLERFTVDPAVAFASGLEEDAW